MLKFTGERIVPGAADCEETFARKMYQEHIARYHFASVLAEGTDVLDVGCGVGYGSRHLAEAGARSVLAIDVAADAVAHACQHYAHPAVAFECVSAADLKTDRRFDLVTCYEMIEHVVEQDAVLDMIQSVLKDDGVLAISTPRPHDAPRSEYHEKELDLESFRAKLEARFATVAAFFENNYFTSFIGRGLPQSINTILPITTRFDVPTADYFIFLVTNAGRDRLQAVREVLAINDDDYVVGLERDVVILHEAEARGDRNIAVLEGEVRDCAVQLERVQVERAGQREELSRLREKLADITLRLATTETDLQKVIGEHRTMSSLHSVALATANAARDGLIERSAEVHAVRQRAEDAEAGHRHELGQAQMLHRVLGEHSKALGEALERIEVNEARLSSEAERADALQLALDGAVAEAAAAQNELENARREMASLRDEIDTVRNDFANTRASMGESIATALSERDAARAEADRKRSLIDVISFRRRGGRGSR